MNYRTGAAGNQHLLQKLLSINRLNADDPTLTSGKILSALTSNEHYFDTFLTQDAEMLRMKDQARRLALYDDPVLITGPTGVGKEVIARAMHGKKEEPYLALNCAGFSETLLESDLFGHMKGAFTDAKENKSGALVNAGEGTVLLDEIDRMPLSIQSKLLRTIQEREVRPVGSSRSIPISCRFICTAKDDLLEKVKLKQFLPDLYGRIMIFHLEITGLSTRPADIELILLTPETDGLGKNGRKLGGLGLQKEHLPLPEKYVELVKLFNVRALIAYQRRIQVFGKGAI